MEEATGERGRAREDQQRPDSAEKLFELSASGARPQDGLPLGQFVFHRGSSICSEPHRWRTLREFQPEAPPGDILGGRRHAHSDSPWRRAQHGGGTVERPSSTRQSEGQPSAAQAAPLGPCEKSPTGSPRLPLPRERSLPPPRSTGKVACRRKKVASLGRGGLQPKMVHIRGVIM
ncbi:unnamed protein product [Prorocentrum cordatum]|uniref:Uncharacterized protein n=1 Tax=Prorocentrum cordatum TaxID=2364126 RepID=A0ABN9WRU5_9DINO|nr:unnamed protein product [Polarella glacialis]